MRIAGGGNWPAPLKGSVGHRPASVAEFPQPQDPNHEEGHLSHETHSYHRRRDSRRFSVRLVRCWYRWGDLPARDRTELADLHPNHYGTTTRNEHNGMADDNRPDPEHYIERPRYHVHDDHGSTAHDDHGSTAHDHDGRTIFHYHGTGNDRTDYYFPHYVFYGTADDVDTGSEPARDDDNGFPTAAKHYAFEKFDGYLRSIPDG